MATSPKKLASAAEIAEKIVSRMKNEPGCEKFVSVAVYKHELNPLGVNWSVNAAECGVDEAVYAEPLARVVQDLQAQFNVG